MLFLLAASVVTFGLAAVQPNNEVITNTANEPGPGKTQQDFFNFFESIGKNDPEQKETYRTILEGETRREQQAFDSMKDEWRSARFRSGKQRLSHDALKREAKKTSAKMPDGTGKQSDGKLSPPSQPEEAPRLKTDEESQSSPLPFIPGPGQSFYEVKTQKDRNYVIVDKTDFIRRLIDNDDIPEAHKVYFLSRPRTFGKTFFLSMLREFLDGKKGLFTGTAIASRGNAMKEDGKWGQRPVISIDFSAISARTVKDFLEKLREKLNAIAERYGIRTKNGVNGVGRLIRALKSKFDFPVSILIDEFDSPVTLAPNKRVLEGIKKQLALFYTEIKSAAFASELWLVLIMGVSRLNIFEGAMNGSVNDITFDHKFSSILGFSKDEMKETFKSHLDAFAVKYRRKTVEAAVKIEDRYGGYRFSVNGGDAVLDSGSVCSSLRKLTLRHFEPKATALGNIVKRMIKEKKGIAFFKRYCIPATDLKGKYNAKIRDSEPLYQEMLSNGYLTVLKLRQDEQKVCLTYPNEGIQSLIEKALPIQLRSQKEAYRLSLSALLQDHLNAGDMEKFKQELNYYAFPVLTPTLKMKVDEKQKEFFATNHIFRMLRTLQLNCKEGRELVRNEKDEPAGDLDLIIYAAEEKRPHYAVSIKFEKTPQETIFQLFEYVVNENVAFERLFDDQPRTDVINLLGLVMRSDDERQQTISSWIFAQYMRKDFRKREGEKVWIKTMKASDPSIMTNTRKYLEAQTFFKKNKEKFVL